MPFKKGDPKPAGSGRKKGYKSIWTLEHRRRVCEDYNFDPVVELMKLFPRLTDSQKVGAIGLLASYNFRKLKVGESKEVSPPAGPVDPKLPQQPDELKALLNNQTNETKPTTAQGT